MYSLADRDRDLLGDILAHGEEALGYLAGVTEAAFLADRKLQLAIERLLEIVGEAAGNLSALAREAIPFDWAAVRGLRNILSHQYEGVNLDVVYRVATRRLPQLLELARTALSE